LVNHSGRYKDLFSTEAKYKEFIDGNSKQGDWVDYMGEIIPRAAANALEIEINIYSTEDFDRWELIYGKEKDKDKD